MIRRYTTSKIVAAKGGCDRCGARWDSKNSVALAAQHHDANSHPTWAEQTLRTVYGNNSARNGQPAETLL